MSGQQLSNNNNSVNKNMTLRVSDIAVSLLFSLPEFGNGVFAQSKPKGRIAISAD